MATLLKHKNLTKLTILMSSMMTMMAGAVVAPSLPNITSVFQQVPHAGLLTRLIITLPALFMALMSPLAGWFIDRFGRKNLILCSYLLYAAAGTSGYYLHDLYPILAGRAFLGIAVAGIMTTGITLVGDYFQGGERTAFLGFQGTFIALGGVVFISLAGFLADIHWQLPFLIYLFSLLVFCMAIPFITEPVRKGPERPAGTGPSAGAAAPYNRGMIYLLYGLVFLGIVFFYMVPVQIPYMLRTIGVSNTLTGLSISSMTLASACISYNYHRIKRRLSFPAVYATAFAVIACGYCIIALGSVLPHFITGLVISGLGIGLLMPSGNLWAMELVPMEIRGRIVGRVSSSMFLGMFLSPVLLQPVVDRFSLPGAFLCASVMMSGMCLALILLKGKMR
ncbi:MFS transporter [Fibrobacterota bacterium]